MLLRPYSLASPRLEVAAASLLLMIFIVVFVGQMEEPSAAVSVLVLIPIAIAAWTLSGLLAAVVAAVAGLELGAASVLEPNNRMTLLLVAITALSIGVVVRLYAGSVAALVGSHRARRIGAADPASAGVDRGAPDGPSVRLLTRRERDVASLAVRGFTAVEMGEQLHIGHRTVETHLAGIYAKLQIRSRGELIRLDRQLEVGRAKDDLRRLRNP